jgi:hypothetical protein
MPERQHVITGWLLRAFGARVRGEWILQVFDKALGTYDEISSEEFLAETDAHSSTVEQGFERIEGPGVGSCARALEADEAPSSGPLRDGRERQP